MRAEWISDFQPLATVECIVLGVETEYKASQVSVPFAEAFVRGIDIAVGFKTTLSTFLPGGQTSPAHSQKTSADFSVGR